MVTVLERGKLDIGFSMFKYSPFFPCLIIPSKSGFQPLNPDSKTWILFHGFGANALCYSSFQVIRFFQNSIHKTSVEEIAMDLFWLSAYLVLALFYLHLVYRRQDISKLLNMLLSFERKFERKEHTW